MQSTAITQKPTIAAIATPVGRGGIGIVRLSGSTAYKIGCLLTQRSVLTPRNAHFARFYGESGVIDEGVVIYFAAPQSFTGEDVVEIQGHGGVVLQNLLLARVFELGARQASAGEFSLRAFENGKMDLLQAEAINDAISAVSDAQALGAIRSLSGDFSKQINELSENLTNLRLYIEASIDFPDEEDVELLTDGVILLRLDTVLSQIDGILATAKQGQILRDGICVVLAGKPNAGKSSILNRLAGNDRAIVTDVAGTTRDTLEETLILKGLTVHLTDTAGLRETADKVEQIGINRAKDAIKKADILLLVYDASCEVDPSALPKALFLQQDDMDAKQLAKKTLMIANKSDLLERAPECAPKDVVYVSCETGQGLDNLVDVLCQKVGFCPSESAYTARIRHIDVLRQVKAEGLLARQQLVVYQAGELAAESLRLAQRALGEITGQVSSDELLGKIFSSFCIGK